MALEQKTGLTSHFHEALVKLIPPYWGKPRVAALLQAYVERVQELEDATWEVLERYTIEGADTARLDVLGRVVGQPRFWADDEIYRAVIRGKIRANRSRGLTEDIVEVIQAVTPTDQPVHVESVPIATAVVWAEAPIGADDIIVALRFLLPKTRAAGVRLNFYWTEDGVDTGAIWDVTDWDDGTVYWSTEAL
jgi:hypothetical protein